MQCVRIIGEGLERRFFLLIALIVWGTSYTMMIYQYMSTRPSTLAPAYCVTGWNRTTRLERHALELDTSDYSRAVRSGEAWKANDVNMSK